MAAEDYVHNAPSTPYVDKTKKADVSTPSLAWREMYKHFELPNALMGGTLEMRKEKTKWLPREPKEGWDAYRNRLNRTVLYGAYRRTVKALAGLAFTSPVTADNVPDELEYLKEDVDNLGTSLTSLANQLLEEQLHFGITHILVDMPQIDGTVTLAQKDELKLRPYFTPISPLNLISWTLDKTGGLVNLSEIRIKEIVVEKDGWGEKEVEQVRQVTPTEVTLWRRPDKNKDFEVYSQTSNSLGYVPLITIYGNKTGIMTATPPLEDLAWLNLRHYQKLSDLDNIEHIVNVPFLFGKGFADGELNGTTIGAYRLISTDRADADLTFVEHSGNAISASQASMDKLEQRMASMGSDIIIRKSVDRQTATARKIDQSESISLLQIMINELESKLHQAFIVAGDWIDIEADVMLNIGNDLKTSDAGPNTQDLLVKFIQENGGMSVDQAIKELQRRGTFADTYKEIGGKLVEQETKEEVNEDNPQEVEEPGEMP